MNRRFCHALVLSVAAFLASAQIHAVEGGIHVTGVGEVEAAPDMATVPLSVQVDGADPAAIKMSVDELTRAILAVVRDLDIAKRDTTARNIRLQPRFRYDKGETRLLGYTASRDISVVVRDLDVVGKLMDRALAAGATRVDPPNYDHSDRKALARQALDLAIENARSEAAHVASQFSVGLGHLTEARTTPAPQPMRYAGAMMARAESADMPLEPGLIRISQTVQASFAIVDG